jgi:hypothetical protein
LKSSVFVERTTVCHIEKPKGVEGWGIEETTVEGCD